MYIRECKICHRVIMYFGEHQPIKKYDTWNGCFICEGVELHARRLY
jgi:hypothetical protein